MAYSCYGLKAKNNDQKDAMQALLDPNVDLVILQGVAGSGKTLLALAAGLEQTLKNPRYTEIIFTRAACGIGTDIGSLPGTEEEKMHPYAGALFDNLEMLSHKKGDTVAAKGEAFNIRNRIKIKALQFMRGRSFVDKWVIIDETQNLTQGQMKVLLTRAGENCKIVCLGDVSQNDNPKLTEEDNGLTYLIAQYEYTKPNYIKSVNLPSGVRSRLCSWASECL